MKTLSDKMHNEDSECFADDVKEFIKELKKLVNADEIISNEMIDELAGDKLI